MAIGSKNDTVQFRVQFATKSTKFPHMVVKSDGSEWGRRVTKRGDMGNEAELSLMEPEGWVGTQLKTLIQMIPIFDVYGLGSGSALDSVGGTCCL